MLSVGLTGGIGAGKSTVARRLTELGAVLIDSDVLAREVIAPGTPGLAKVADTFGADILDATGALDRAALAQRVFADPEARTRLEAIIHPLVRQRSVELAEAAADDAIVVNDVPLLAEVGLAPTFDLVIVVEASHELRLERLTARGLPAEQAQARIAAQASDDVRRAVADVVIDNAGTVDDLNAAVDALWHERLVPFEDNKRNRRIARRSETITMADYSPQWPSRFERLAARLRHVMGDKALRVDHVGSTAVPGLVAKDVIDIQITVADLADADAAAEQLAAAGFPRLEGITNDTPKPFAPEVSQWRKRMHCGCDPRNITQIHIRQVDSAGWRYALLFVDWLRADTAARDDYAHHKRALANDHATTSDYADAKEPWFDLALPRAEDWAKRTNWHPA
ncbi:dephospho-CoA kinase [Stackebrandtia nassauensis]|uniref:Dephospho-CoA kinase n=1 Tax=Stackebrandtia nassauensis (strain DSM 44728 / CIP 108903 / NRRL B-16338 / NBRC 102104 / LLR-40K-21) TaxID=446470 RepID=D3PXU1_STANL|nr:dephospho-CoA kinase [Stackebrandtia nassauensis]ADD43421.1 dephospho-CoA kinase [Stackebrandtia nassauensis DSM 44728]